MQSHGANLLSLFNSPAIAVYENKSTASNLSRRFIVSTPETRRICNDPFCVGVEYTRLLSKACSRAIKVLSVLQIIHLKESQTTVLNILRGGLNFGLREAVTDALNFNTHSSAFLSAQRVRAFEDPSQWTITESAYEKLQLGPKNQLVFGDIVATGSSLAHALSRVGAACALSKSEIESILFFTIGGPKSHQILDSTIAQYNETGPSLKSAAVVYFEGIFEVASAATPLRIKIDGTDLLRRSWHTECQMAPEFINSQYENPSFPLERCTIYDAGSRSFHVPEHLSDVAHYWQQLAQLAKDGATFNELVEERCPQLEPSRFGVVDLAQLCERQLGLSRARI